MDGLSFLQDITGFAQAQAKPTSANRPIKLATIDPTYDPAGYADGTLPKVTFDGESTLSGKLYPVMGPYWPQPSDRVVLAPVGTTYVIIGAIDVASSAGQMVGWTTPTLASGYSHNGNDNGNLQYRVISLFGTKYVQWRGAVNKGSGATITTMPSGARPSIRRSVLAARNANVMNSVKIDFNADGTCILVGETTGGAPAPTWISLNAIQYPL